MTFIYKFFYSGFVFLGGWLFNFIFDIQFAAGLASGWLLRQGFDDLARMLQDLIY